MSNSLSASPVLEAFYSFLASQEILRLGLACCSDLGKTIATYEDRDVSLFRLW